jgi:hypothetical protein
VSVAPAGSATTATAAATRELVARRLDERRSAGDAFFAGAAPVLATLCHHMAERG